MIRHSFLAVGLLVGLTAEIRAQPADAASGKQKVNRLARLNAELVNWNGVALLGKKEIDKAIAEFSLAIRLNPNFAEAYNNRGAAWLKKKDDDKAIADFDQAILLDPNDASAYNNRGIAWENKQEYDKAIDDFNQAVRLNPKDAAAYYNRAEGWKDKNEYDKAIADFNRAIRLDTNYTKAYRRRGVVWWLKNEYDKAIADFAQAVGLDPNDTYAHNGWAWILATCPDDRVRNGNRAVELATIACELTSWKDASPIDTLAAANAEAGDFDLAIKFQKQAIVLDPNTPGFRDRLRLFENHQTFREKRNNQQSPAP